MGGEQMSNWVINDWVSEGMNEWVNEWMSEGMNEWVSEWMNEWMSEWMNEWMNEWMIDWLIEWMNEWWYIILHQGSFEITTLNIMSDFQIRNDHVRFGIKLDKGEVISFVMGLITSMEDKHEIHQSYTNVQINQTKCIHLEHWCRIQWHENQYQYKFLP